jgi:hypothetical protein
MTTQALPLSGLFVAIVSLTVGLIVYRRWMSDGAKTVSL